VAARGDAGVDRIAVSGTTTSDIRHIKPVIRQ
jgi:hypothetical protein